LIDFPDYGMDLQHKGIIIVLLAMVKESIGQIWMNIFWWNP
jgi:hypothetical protein